MILPLMMSLQAIGMRHYAGLGMMQNHNSMMSLLNHVGNNVSFNGGFGMDEAYLRQLSQKETQMDCQNQTYALLYEISKNQEEAARKRMKEEAKSFSIFA
ncbi:hypothetical protein IJI31_00580 [bacterium]|nr:hypothetical protein [bacterium]